MSKEIINTQAELDIKLKDIFSNSSFAKDFSNTQVNCVAVINASNFHTGYSNFNEACFKEKVTFIGAFSQETIFTKTQFEKDAIFDNVIFTRAVKFNEAKFFGVAMFDNATFNNNARFNQAEFREKATFQNTTFEKLADFYYVKFHRREIFLRTDFKGTTVFSRTTFFENALFTFSLLGENTIFRHATFKKGFDLSLAANISGDMNVFHIEHGNLKKFKTVPYKNIDEYEDMVYNKGEIPIENKRETLRIFKNQLINQNNKVEAIKYHKFEMKTYTKELLLQSKTLRVWKIPIGNLIINLLNKISNNYGSNWILGIGFTIGIGLLFFSLAVHYINYDYILNFHSSFSDTWKAFKFSLGYFSEFIFPFHKNDLLDRYTLLSNKFYLYDFLGRLFVSYGIYQTVIAFRKFNK